METLEEPSENEIKEIANKILSGIGKFEDLYEIALQTVIRGLKENPKLLQDEYEDLYENET